MAAYCESYSNVQYKCLTMKKKNPAIDRFFSQNVKNCSCCMTFIFNICSFTINDITHNSYKINCNNNNFINKHFIINFIIKQFLIQFCEKDLA